MKSCKIMIMTASIGHGHNQVAKVMRENLLKENNQLEIKIVDFMEILENLFGKIIITAYLKIIDTFPSWYHFIYYTTSKINKGEKVKDLFAYRYKKKVLNIIQEYNPDAILFTNPFLLIIVGYLKKLEKINAYTAVMITDYTAHSIWINSYVDRYFVGCEELKSELIIKGIPKNRIEISGIPIDKKFYMENNKYAIRNTLGFKVEIPTILIMGGGLGLGSIDGVLTSLNSIKHPLQLIVVTGTNHTLKKKLDNRIEGFNHLLKVFGFCDNIYELMDCADLLISKSGGVTVTEAINKKLPMLIVDPIPGQELENAKYLLKIGVGILISEPKEIKEKLEDLMIDNQKLLKEMQERCRPLVEESVAKIILEDIKNDKSYIM